MPLRRVIYDDLELMLSWRNHPLIRTNMFSQDIIELEQHHAWFLQESKKETSLWLIHIDSKGTPAGIVYFTEIDHPASNSFWGFYAAPEAPAGTGTRLGVEALDYFFTEQGFHKLNADVLESNERSHRFHRKLGFQVEGLFREQYRSEDAYQNVTRYGLLASEWIVHREKIKEI